MDHAKHGYATIKENCDPMKSARAPRPDTDEVLASLNELMEIVTVAMPAYLHAQDPRVIRAVALIAKFKGKIN
jgi:hypothetical protein